jgi:RNA-binding protein
MKPLSPKQKHFLRAMAHKLKPVVIVGGAGLTDGVINEIDQSIAHHELIKVRINAVDRPSRAQLIKQINDTVGCQLVFSIGHIAIFYRAAKKPVIALPKGPK